MKNLTKLVAIGIFALFGMGMLLHSASSAISTTASAQTKPTPPADNSNLANMANDANMANVANMANAANGSNANASNTSTTPTPQGNTAVASDKTIPVHFTLGLDSFSEYGEVSFNHDTHASKNYSPDGKSVVGCVECHHTDQPKSALKPPLLTSERDAIMTFEQWKSSPQKVSLCRACHFQDGEVPDDKEMPIAVYDDGEKDLTNELAYHINCNTCHDAAAKLRPEVKKTKGFATTNDCMICHKEN